MKHIFNYNTHLQPNILLIMTDQMRADSIGLSAHHMLITPNIDMIGGQGCLFNRAYSTCPSCIPARRSLLTGQYPSSSGSVGFDTPLYDTPTLPYLLSKAGYSSILVGRNMHQHPDDENPGYDSCMLGSTCVENDCYAQMLKKEVPLLGGIRSMGVSFNGWQAKSWPLEEHLHPTNWVSYNSRELINKQSGDKPLFLTASFYAPHPPFLPPDFYYQRYCNMDLPDKAVGDWVEDIPETFGVDSPRVNLSGEKLHMAKAAYYGLINHIDNQLTYLMSDFISKSRERKRPWIIVFTSDHGEMLGDHYYFRKCEPFEGSCRIPFLIQSEGLGQKEGVTTNTPVCLEDVLPTLLEFSGVTIPDHVDGQSLVPLLRSDLLSVRHYLHCEHSPVYSDEQGFQMLTDGSFKYIWRPMTGKEYLFNLNNDPMELKNIIANPPVQEVCELFREKIIKLLRFRPEGFVINDKLNVLSQRYPPIMKSFLSE